MKVQLVRVTADPKQAMAIAGSNCYDSVPSEKIVDHCYKSGHHSILEFADFHFKVSGVSRALSHQLVRHRLASYAQRSQRYVVEDGFGYVTPKSVVTSGFHEQYIKHMMATQDLYNRMVKFGVPAEDARYILPNACDTVIDMKMDFRELMRFCNERLCSRSQWEIRQLAILIMKLVTDRYPELGKFLVPKCEVHSPYCFCSEDKNSWEKCKRSPHISDVFGGKTNV